MSQISIIIPIYNCEKYLKECLSSLQNQSFEDFEVICINDCYGQIKKNPGRIR